MAAPAPGIEGGTAPGFHAVRDAFAANFADHGEIGAAAVSVYLGGEKVVDLWGGTAAPERDRPWRRDTLQAVYSATKGATSACALPLAQRGELDLDAPVREHWPEFAARGKQDIPARWLLTHQAGLPVLDEPVPLAAALAWDPVVEALAAQRPAWPPRPGTATTRSPSAGSSARSCAGCPAWVWASSSAPRSPNRPGSTSGSACPGPSGTGSARSCGPRPTRARRPGSTSTTCPRRSARSSRPTPTRRR
nr:serine hydrolase domain-containing protein [Actinokineospora pegani]